MMIGVDRLDYSKGLAQRMDAFERFLALYPDWRGKVTYLQIKPKSRSEIREYSDMERAISTAAGHINGSYGEASWTPIRYVNRAYSRTVLAGLYRSARAGLVTPLRDGMNLSPRSIAAQDKRRPRRPVHRAWERRPSARRPFWSIPTTRRRSRDDCACALHVARRAA
jgi:trehalose 6-phosphate synthase